jgi:hypothetical protein
MQCQDLDNNGQTSTYGGSPYHVGGFAEGVSASGVITWLPRYNLFDTAGVWFLDILSGIQSGAASYGSASSVDFTASTVATLDDMIDEAVNFVTLGARDSAFGGDLKTGLSTTYPRAVYLAAGPATANTGTWDLTPTVIGGTPAKVLFGSDIAVALFALNAAGEAAATVNAVFDWLMSFGSNPANAAPSEDPQLLIGNRAGTYKPTMALAVELDVLADDLITPMAQEHTGSGYSWLSAGLLAPIASVRIPAAFAAAKEQLGVPQPSRRGETPAYKQIGESGYSGLSFQISGVQQ